MRELIFAIILLGVGIFLHHSYYHSHTTVDHQSNNFHSKTSFSQTSNSTFNQPPTITTKQTPENDLFKEEEEENMENSKIIIKGLPVNITSSEIDELFSIFGERESSFAVFDFTTKEGQGEGFVHFKSPKSARAAIKAFDGLIYNGEEISVKALEMKHKTIIIGSGLAACCAANEALKAGSYVIMLEKDSQFGGNSAKASSGINAALNEEDFERFMEDTLKSSEGLSNPNILRRFVINSQTNVHYLEEELGIKLDQVVKCGGHSVARTFRNSVNDSINIGYLLVSKFREKLLSNPNFQLQFNSYVKSLLHDNRDFVVGVEVTISGISHDESHRTVKMFSDSVIIATGGFSQNKDLLAKYAPQLLPFPSTNKIGTNGEGILLCEGVGAKLIDVEHVQLHPTGFIDPASPDNKVKILAPEALRGYGALLINEKGDRFVNELGLRKHLSDAITHHCANNVSWLVLNQNILDNFGSSLSFYLKKQIIRKYETLQSAADHMNLPIEKLRSTLEAYNSHVESKEVDLFGKSSFPSSFDLSAPLYLSQVTPSIHYTMGGIAYNEKTQVLRKEDNLPIPGLFIAGEASGGLHGANRLAGNSLAECVVFGRIAGKYATMNYRTDSLSPNHFTPISLIKRIQLSNSTSLFQFALTSIDSQTGLRLGEYIALRIPNTDVVRYYSPISRPDKKGQLDLLIKTNIIDGAMTKYLTEMNYGDQVECKGPVGGPSFQIGDSKTVCMLAGGTGISSMIQVIRAHILEEKRNGFAYDLRLLYGCKNESEILLRKSLEDHASKHPNLNLHYVLENPPDNWNMSTGFITPEILKSVFPPPRSGAFIFVCGPPGFCKVMKSYLIELGYVQDKEFYCFL